MTLIEPLLLLGLLCASLGAFLSSHPILGVFLLAAALWLYCALVYAGEEKPEKAVVADLRSLLSSLFPRRRKGGDL
jgi:hypothetical protein